MTERPPEPIDPSDDQLGFTDDEINEAQGYALDRLKETREAKVGVAVRGLNPEFAESAHGYWDDVSDQIDEGDPEAIGLVLDMQRNLVDAEPDSLLAGFRNRRKKYLAIQSGELKMNGLIIEDLFTEVPHSPFERANGTKLEQLQVEFDEWTDDGNEDFDDLRRRLEEGIFVKDSAERSMVIENVIDYAEFASELSSETTISDMARMLARVEGRKVDYHENIAATATQQE